MKIPVETRISIELVPRDALKLTEELRLVREKFASVNIINIPDLPRFPLRSWDGCVLARTLFPHTIPHIRAVDIHADQPLVMAETLQAHGIHEVLVVTGDPHPDQPPMSPSAGQVEKEPSTVLQMIRRFKKEIPGIQVYAAVDPYRQGFRQEQAYIQQKLDAGADGFFTQPFFDIRMMEIYAELLTETQVFWGVSPVTTEKSRLYWETRNNAIFPQAFSPSLAWNRQFAKQALTFARERQTHIYFMPIRTNVEQYLEGILS